ncbi:hypothetical protein ACFY0G_05905 [Streptomyces sp. NPDC001552]|uniref:hypothetical protein n=1 Tax=Streptomyces sp. NPDC001552 TaxID=3364587 RepID=UPI003688A064
MDEVSALYTSVLPSVVVPAVASRFDTAPGRGASVLHGPDGAPGATAPQRSRP